MINLRIVRHDREQLLADCESSVVPASGEVLQLDIVDSDGEKRRPSTLFRSIPATYPPTATTASATIIASTEATTAPRQLT